MISRIAKIRWQIPFGDFSDHDVCWLIDPCCCTFSMNLGVGHFSTPSIVRTAMNSSNDAGLTNRLPVGKTIAFSLISLCRCLRMNQSKLALVGNRFVRPALRYASVDENDNISSNMSLINSFTKKALKQRSFQTPHCSVWLQLPVFLSERVC
jgi:hypothetical protein